MCSPLAHTTTSQISVGWTPPPPNHYKLNTDGSCLGNPSKDGNSGVIWNALGGWLMGFSKIFQWATNNQMELLALREGFQIIGDH